MSGIVKAVKGVVSGVFGGGDAAQEAAQIGAASTQRGLVSQEALAREGLGEARRQFDIGQRQLRPFAQAGRRALAFQENLLGTRGAERQESAFQAFRESPGQRFLRERGERSLLRSSAAIGGLGGGNVRQALQEQAIGVAGTQLGEFQNRLAAISGTGLGAAGRQAALGAQFGGQAVSTLGGIGQTQFAGQQAIGQQRATGILGAQQANAALGGQFLGAGLGAAAGAAGLFGGAVGAGGGALLGLLSDKNMKEDVRDLDLKQCFDTVMGMDLKSWRYLEAANIDRKTHFGPMAQDAPQCIKIPHKEMLNLHDELMLIAGALQYAKQSGVIIDLKARV